MQTHVDRIRLMSPREVLWRLRSAASARARYWLRPWIQPRLDGADPGFRPLFAREEMDQEGSLRFWETEPWHDRILEDLLRGRFHCAGEVHELQDPPDWSFDPTTGARLALVNGRHYLFLKMYRSANMVFLRTLNRHYHLVHLAKGAAVRGRGGEEMAAQILDWIRSNPYLRGINWSDSLDAAMRIFNWCLALTFLPRSLPGDLLRATAGSVAQQVFFIEKNLSRFSSGNNHLIGEYMGLLAAGLSFPGLPRAGSWREMGLRGLEEEVRRQWTEDGVHRERSLSYHRWLLECLLILWSPCRRQGIPFSMEFEERLRRGVEYLAQAIDHGGEVVFLGDCGHETTVDLHYLSFQTTNLWHSLLRLASRLGLHRDPLLDVIGEEDARVPWMSPPEAASPRDRGRVADPPQAQVAPRPVRESRAYREGGIFFLRDGRPFDEETCLTFRAGPMGYLSLCAHAHADQLSLALSVRGRQFLVDPGTYGYYVVADRWRHYFRGTRAHNTLTVDGLDQARTGGNMMWLEKAHGEMTGWSDGGEEAGVAGEHLGYLRLPDPVVHHRSARVLKREKRIEILDQIHARGEHRLELNLHFHPRVTVTREGPHRFLAEREGRRLIVELDRSLAVRALEGDEREPGGWYSPSFGVKEACMTLRGDCRSRGEVLLRTTLSWI